MAASDARPETAATKVLGHVRQGKGAIIDYVNLPQAPEIGRRHFDAGA